MTGLGSPRVRRSGRRAAAALAVADGSRAPAYGYSRGTSPHIDALARRGTLFERAYTDWPKTRGSFVALMTGRRVSGDVSSRRAEDLRVCRRELELFLDATDREWGRIREALARSSGEERLSAESCEQLQALGYVQGGCR
jgi:hypothetical protein